MARSTVPLRTLALLSVLFAAGAAHAGSDAAQRELRDGVSAFRAGRYERSLEIFLHLKAAGEVPEIEYFLGINLYKLSRYPEAIAAFRDARQAGLMEPVAAYYEATSYYRLGLLEPARRAFRSLLDGAARPPLSPRLRSGALRFVKQLDRSSR